jgi:large subunit ribosomal protein L10
MAITKEKKKEIIAGLEKIISESKSVVFVQFNKLLVKEASEIRRTLKKEDVNYLVVKKSLLGKVLGDAKIEGGAPKFAGELALVFGNDQLSPAREIYGFQKKLDGKVSITGGIFENHFKSLEEMMNIATIPSLDVLRGMFVNVINSPIQRFAVVLGRVAEKKN